MTSWSGSRRSGRRRARSSCSSGCRPTRPTRFGPACSTSVRIRTSPLRCGSRRRWSRKRVSRGLVTLRGLREGWLVTTFPELEAALDAAAHRHYGKRRRPTWRPLVPAVALALRRGAGRAHVAHPRSRARRRSRAGSRRLGGDLGALARAHAARRRRGRCGPTSTSPCHTANCPRSPPSTSAGPRTRRAGATRSTGRGPRPIRTTWPASTTATTSRASSSSAPRASGRGTGWPARVCPRSGARPRPCSPTSPRGLRSAARPGRVGSWPIRLPPGTPPRSRRVTPTANG